MLASDPDWKGSKNNVQVEWETGEITFEPLSIIAADDPVTCAAYAKENDLLTLEGWCRFRSLAKKDKVLARAIKQSKIRQVRRSQTLADGHLTPEPIENIYYGVVSLRNLRLVIFLGKLNNLELWGADIGNAYLEAFTDEKLYIVAGPEFQELEGYILIFLKALYGLKSSGKRWAEVIHSILRDMKFLPSKADPCIWLRKAPNLK